MDGNCSNIDFGKSKNQVVYMRERDRTHADQKFLLKGRYVMCWQSAAQACYDLQTQTLPGLVTNTFIQVNDFNFFFGIHLLELVDSGAPEGISLAE